MVGGLFESMAENYRNNLPEAIMNYASYVFQYLHWTNKLNKENRKRTNY